MNSNIKLSPILCFLALTLVNGCAQQTQLRALPDNSSITVEGAFKGRGQARFQYRSGRPRPYCVEIRAEGYKPLVTTIMREYHADSSLGLLFAGFLPFLFSARLEPSYNFQLEALPNQSQKDLIQEEKRKDNSILTDSLPEPKVVVSTPVKGSCLSCLKKNPNESKFCIHCGTKLP